MIWTSFVRNVVSFLPKRFRDAKLEFKRQRSDIKEFESREGFCSSYVNDEMPAVIAHAILERYFDESIKSEILDLAATIRTQLKQIFTKSDWMDAESIKNAEEKVNIATFLTFD